MPPTQRVVEVVLRFERTEDPICGHISGAGGIADFDGWLGLVMAIERALDGPGEKSSGCQPR